MITQAKLTTTKLKSTAPPTTITPEKLTTAKEVRRTAPPTTTPEKLTTAKEVRRTAPPTTTQVPLTTVNDVRSTTVRNNEAMNYMQQRTVVPEVGRLEIDRISCYQCNSRQNASCEPINRQKIKPTRCGSSLHQSCRKMYQKVGELRIIDRACSIIKAAETSSIQEACYDRRGGQGISVRSCYCSGNACNSAPSLVVNRFGSSVILTSWLIWLCRFFA